MSRAFLADQCYSLNAMKSINTTDQKVHVPVIVLRLTECIVTANPTHMLNGKNKTALIFLKDHIIQKFAQSCIQRHTNTSLLSRVQVPTLAFPLMWSVIIYDELLLLRLGWLVNALYFTPLGTCCPLMVAH